MASGLWLTLASGGLVGCLYDELPNGRVCRDTATAIASRVFDCTGDDEASNALAARFDREARCLVDDSQRERIVEFYDCPRAIASLECAQVEANGDDLGLWLESEPVCGEFLALGEAPDGELDAGGMP